MPTLDFRGRSFIERHHEVLPHHTLVLQPDLSLLPAVAAADDAQNAAALSPSVQGNLIVEGDNLLALEALLPHYRGRVKCIYIDPPYNTGNEHWVYNDNVSGALFKEWLGQEVGPQGEDFNRHDKWCCMMWPRLQLLKELLRDDGVIFVSIDDNEVHHLRMLMDEIFGDENFLGSPVWQKRYAPSNDTVDFSATHEYLLVYAKQREFTNGGKAVPTLGRVDRTEQQNSLYKNPDNDPRGVWASDNYLCNKSAEQRPNLYYPITQPKTGKQILPSRTAVWRYSEERHAKNVEENRVWWGTSQENETPRYKRFLTEVGGTVSDTWWAFKDSGHNDEAKKQLKEILSDVDNPFDTPKPARLIKRLLRLATTDDPDSDDIILDSFAGSGTTAHAVLQLNQEDGGNRKFILVQMPHDNKDDERAGKNIARDITRERVKRVIEGVGATVPALGGSFSYATLSNDPLTGYYGILRADTPWAELAGYVWATETHTAFEPTAPSDQATGRVGQVGELAVYLLYTPEPDTSRAFDAATLAHLAQHEPARSVLVYAEKHWVDADVLRRWQKQHHKSVTVRLLPTQLR